MSKKKKQEAFPIEQVPLNVRDEPTRDVLSVFLAASRADKRKIPTASHAIEAAVSEREAQIVRPQTDGSAPQKVEVVPSRVVQALANIATNAWRAKTKMVDSETGEAKEEMRRIYRHVEAIFETLKQIGLETTDLAGSQYDSGMALKVVSFEQTPGISNEEIKETIKPSVAWQGRLIQMGEVIVGTPQTA